MQFIEQTLSPIDIERPREITLSDAALSEAKEKVAQYIAKLKN